MNKFIFLLLSFTSTIISAQEMPYDSLSLVFLEEGKNLYHEKLYENAIKNLMKSIDIDSSNSEAYKYLGLCYDRRFDNLNAVKFYEKSFALNPKNSSVLLNLALKYRILGKNNECINTYQRFILLEPKNVEGYIGAALVYGVIKNYKLSNKYSKKALRIYNRENSKIANDVRYGIAINYYYLDKKNKAKNILTKLYKEEYNIPRQDILDELNVR